MKIKVLKCSSQDYWYSNRIGEVFEVDQCQTINNDWHSDAEAGSFEKGDCIVITQKGTLQEQLQTAKDAVASLEAQLAAIAAEEANRPFTQAEYEAVVAQFRKCAGRKVFEYKDHYNYCVEMFKNRVTGDDYPAYGTSAMFNVWFSTEDYAYNAIKEVGEENLRRAWRFEMSIGL